MLGSYPSSSIVNVLAPKFELFNRGSPRNRDGFLSPKDIPPAGPNPGVVNICGDEIECFRPLLCSMDRGGIPGDARPPIAAGCGFAAPVFKLSRLGFRLPFSGGGLINDGEEGSEV